MTRNSQQTTARKRNLAAARRAKDKKRKSEDRLGEAIVAWEETIDFLETALVPFKHQKGKSWSLEQNVMALEMIIYLMKEAKLDADEEDCRSYLYLTNINKIEAIIHGMAPVHLKKLRTTMLDEKKLIVSDDSTRSAGSPLYPSQKILNEENEAFIYEFIDPKNALGKTFTKISCMMIPISIIVGLAMKTCIISSIQWRNGMRLEQVPRLVVHSLHQSRSSNWQLCIF
jgi:hypothetical protein